MKTAVFNFTLPPDRIANQPVYPRDSAKLLHICSDKTFEDKHVFNLDELLHPGDVLIFNDTKVIPARLTGIRGAAKIEVTLFKQVDLSSWETLIKNARRLKTGDTIHFSNSFQAEVITKKPSGSVILKFNQSGAALMEQLHLNGSMPLPPYIKRPTGSLETDKTNYQTIYARHEGAVAAPTAGLHFTSNLFNRLSEKGILSLFVTLHVGGGTFLPVKVDDTDNHKMHAEFGVITPETAKHINMLKQSGHRIIPVGTTSLRLLESAADEMGHVHAFEGETDIFITPGYRFKITDALFTNFHLSGSTLFMLVCAFAGIDTMKQAYTHAIKNNYRFFSYGDACLIDYKSHS